jgi:hypothetical protein
LSVTQGLLYVRAVYLRLFFATAGMVTNVFVLIAIYN